MFGEVRQIRSAKTHAHFYTISAMFKLESTHIKVEILFNKHPTKISKIKQDKDKDKAR